MIIKNSVNVEETPKREKFAAIPNICFCQNLPKLSTN